jgi:hypothetical protein
MAVGLDLLYGNTTQKFPDNPAQTDQKSTSNSIGAGAFFRYYCMTVGSFSVFTEAACMYTTGTYKASYHDVLLNTNVDPKGMKTDKLGFNITPGIAYKVNDHFELDAYLGLFAIDFNHTVVTDLDAPADDINYDNTFGLGINNGKALAFGFVYNF